LEISVAGEEGEGGKREVREGRTLSASRACSCALTLHILWVEGRLGLLAQACGGASGEAHCLDALLNSSLLAVEALQELNGDAAREARRDRAGGSRGVVRGRAACP
jgi:hypothetical protein